MNLSHLSILNNEWKLAIVAYAINEPGNLEQTLYTSFREIESRFEELGVQVKENSLSAMLTYLVKGHFLRKASGRDIRKKFPEFKERRYYSPVPMTGEISTIAWYLLHECAKLNISIYPIIGQTSIENHKRHYNANRFIVWEKLHRGSTQTELEKKGFSAGSITNHFDVLLKNGWLKEPSPLKYGDSRMYRIMQGKREELLQYLETSSYNTFPTVFTDKPFTKNDVAAVFGKGKEAAYQFVRKLRVAGFIEEVGTWRKGARYHLTHEGERVYQRIVHPLIMYSKGYRGEASFKVHIDNKNELVSRALSLYEPYIHSAKKQDRVSGVVDLMTQQGRLSRRRLAELTGLSYNTVNNIVAYMRRNGFVEPAGSEKMYTYWALTKKGRLAAKGVITV